MANMPKPVLKNVESGQLVEVMKSPFSIGRGLTSDYVIENKIVSRTHCSFHKSEEGWTLTDSSTNGTLVNDSHYKGKTTPILKHNDEICLGHHSYTYKFITELDKALNDQVEKLKSQKINANTSTLNEVRSPGTPNSFDEYGVSDDLLNNLADDLLNTMNKPSSSAESHPWNINRLEDVEQPTTSNCRPSPQLSEQGPSASEASINPPTPNNNELQPVVSDNWALDQLNILAETNLNVPVPEASKDRELNKESIEIPQSSSGSSANTIIYSLPGELLEASQPSSSYTTQKALNIDNVDIMTAQVRVGGTNVNTTGFNTSTKPRDLLAESIEAVVQGYLANVASGSSATASTSVQSTSVSSLTSTTVSLTSPLNINKKVKVMTVNSGVVSQLRPVTGQMLTAYTVGTGQTAPVVRRLTQNQMDQLLAANQARMPIVVLPTGSVGTSTVTLAARSHRVATRRSVLNTSAPAALGSAINRGLRTYQRTNPGVLNAAAGSSVLVTESTLLQPDGDGITLAGIETGSSRSNIEDIGDLAVPVAVQEVVIDSTDAITDGVKLDAASTNQGIPSVQCHDSQEPGTSKVSEKVENNNSKQNNQNHYEEMENELMCTICVNLFIKAVTLGCSHSFCQYCIGEWKKKKTECPICRNKITSTTRTLVLDNIIEKMLETASEEDKQDRTAAMEERKKIEEAENAKKNQQNANKGVRGRGRRNNRENQPGNNPTAVITIADSPATTDSDNSGNSDADDYSYDDYYSDDWYEGGRRGAFYGGYGRCYNCGGRGHWSNGCPYR